MVALTPATPGRDATPAICYWDICERPANESGTWAGMLETDTGCYALLADTEPPTGDWSGFWGARACKFKVIFVYSFTSVGFRGTAEVMSWISLDGSVAKSDGWVTDGSFSRSFTGEILELICLSTSTFVLLATVVLSYMVNGLTSVYPLNSAAWS